MRPRFSRYGGILSSRRPTISPFSARMTHIASLPYQFAVFRDSRAASGLLDPLAKNSLQEACPRSVRGASVDRSSRFVATRSSSRPPPKDDDESGQKQAIDKHRYRHDLVE